MSKGLKALMQIEKELAKAWGMDIAYDRKVFDLFHIVGKELQALEIILNKECIFKGLQDVTQEEYDLLKEVLL